MPGAEAGRTGLEGAGGAARVGVGVGERRAGQEKGERALVLGGPDSCVVAGGGSCGSRGVSWEARPGARGWLPGSAGESPGVSAPGCVCSRARSASLLVCWGFFFSFFFFFFKTGGGSDSPVGCRPPLVIGGGKRAGEGGLFVPNVIN